MSNKDDKWSMFKNYMHNELGISKLDIENWIKDAVKEEARSLVAHSNQNFDVRDLVRKEARTVLNTNYGRDLKDAVAIELAKDYKIARA